MLDDKSKENLKKIKQRIREAFEKEDKERLERGAIDKVVYQAHEERLKAEWEKEWEERSDRFSEKEDKGPEYQKPLPEFKSCADIIFKTEELKNGK